MIDGKLTISRPTFSDGTDIISIQVNDLDAKVKFLQINISLENFAKVLTGQSRIECDIEPSNSDVVGKICERKTLKFPLPDGSTYNRKDVAKSLLDKYTPDGWVASDYFSSQNSFVTDSEQTIWTITDMRKWVNR